MYFNNNAEEDGNVEIDDDNYDNYDGNAEYDYTNDNNDAKHVYSRSNNDKHVNDDVYDVRKDNAEDDQQPH